MKIIKPDYYDQFACSASRCRYTCCREWTIAVDEKTEEKWKTLLIPAETGDKLRASGKTVLADLVKKGTEGTSISLGESGLCPLLKEDGLCSVVLSYGEENLSCTCHIFPRKCQRYEGRLEFSLDPGCPEVLDILWQKESFRTQQSEEDHLSGSMEELAAAAEETGKEEELLFLIRSEAMGLIEREDIPLSVSWTMLFGLLLDFYEKEDRLTAGYVREMFAASVLNPLKETVLKAKEQRVLTDHFEEVNELFLDISENYRKKKLYASVLEELADRAEWFELTDDRYVEETSQVFQEDVWSALEPKIRALMLEELYSGMLMPGGSLYSMVLKTQWLALVMTMIRHGLYLRWELDEAMEEEKAKAAVTVLLRMTGYSDADIEEYLESSFEAPIWSWGYMALIA